MIKRDLAKILFDAGALKDPIVVGEENEDKTDTYKIEVSVKEKNNWKKEILHARRKHEREFKSLEAVVTTLKKIGFDECRMRF